jgi:hypothetical protein
MRPLPRHKDGRSIVSWLSTLVRKTVCAFRRSSAAPKMSATKRRTSMNDIERRGFIQGVGIISGPATAATLITQPALAQTPPQHEAGR